MVARDLERASVAPRDLRCHHARDEQSGSLMNRRTTDWHARRCRQSLTHALFLLEEGAYVHAMIYTMLAVLRFAEWLVDTGRADDVVEAIHEMTDHDRPEDVRPS
jgi:hypothetical protein